MFVRKPSAERRPTGGLGDVRPGRDDHRLTIPYRLRGSRSETSLIAPDEEVRTRV